MNASGPIHMNGSLPSRKPRPQGPLSTITPEQRAVLHRWLREGLIYKEIVAHCVAELGFKTSSSTLSDYYSAHYAEIHQGATEQKVTAPAAKPIELELTLRLQITPQLRISSEAASIKILGEASGA